MIGTATIIPKYSNVTKIVIREVGKVDREIALNEGATEVGAGWELNKHLSFERGQAYTHCVVGPENAGVMLALEVETYRNCSYGAYDWDQAQVRLDAWRETVV